jgi:phosphoglycerate kinase
VTVAQYFPGKAVAGFLLEKEIKFLGQTLGNPARPFYAIIGGAKISTKLGVLKALLGKLDALLIGGAMAYTFFRAQGISVGASLYEAELLEQAKDILEYAKSKNVKLLLPIDNLIAKNASQEAEVRIVDTAEGIPEGYQGLDIGPKTIQEFTGVLRDASTVLWNGPLGVFEIPKFANGTLEIAKAVTQLKATTIVGGGDSVAALQAMGLGDKVTHLSTGGGASLEYIEFGSLPGIEALSPKDQAMQR